MKELCLCLDGDLDLPSKKQMIGPIKYIPNIISADTIEEHFCLELSFDATHSSDPSGATSISGSCVFVGSEGISVGFIYLWLFLNNILDFL